MILFLFSHGVCIGQTKQVNLVIEKEEFATPNASCLFLPMVHVLCPPKRAKLSSEKGRVNDPERRRSPICSILPMVHALRPIKDKVVVGKGRVHNPERQWFVSSHGVFCAQKNPKFSSKREGLMAPNAVVVQFRPLLATKRAP